MARANCRGVLSIRTSDGAHGSVCRPVTREKNGGGVVNRTGAAPVSALRPSCSQRPPRHSAARAAKRRRSCDHAIRTTRRRPGLRALRARVRRAPASSDGHAVCPFSHRCTSIIARLMMSAAVPCIGALIALRSAYWRSWWLRERISGRYRRRPNTVSTSPAREPSRGSRPCTVSRRGNAGNTGRRNAAPSRGRYRAAWRGRRPTCRRSGRS